MNFLTISAVYRDVNGLHRFSSPFSRQCSFGKLSITNRFSEKDGSGRLKVGISASSRVELRSLSVELSYPEEVKTVVVIGFQSWTGSREYRAEERMRGIRPLPGRIFKLRYIGDYHFAEYPRKPGRFHSYTYTYFRHGDDPKGDVIDFYGSLDEDSGYTLYHIDLKEQKLRILKDVEGAIIDGNTLEFAILHLKGTGEDLERGIFDRYARALGIGDRKKTVTGWTSWYNYYLDISEQAILENLKAFEDNSIPADVFQIDDGYETGVGDWLSVKPEFPRGMKFMAEAIREKGYVPGLWLAPFLCERKSALAKQHPEWILRDNRGRKVSAGWIPQWSGNTYALDIYNERFRDYLKEVFHTVFEEWEFGMVKLDFLYAAAMIPHSGRSRGQIMAEGCRFLRELAGDHPILGCGVPLGSGFGQFEYCRVGSDVALSWEDSILKFFRYRERVSTINSLKSTIGRRHLGGTLFLNDPDVFILRNEGNRLTADQKYTLFLLNNLFGQLVFTSDTISRYDASTLELYKSMFPLKLKNIHRVDNRDGLYSVRFSIKNSDYYVYANLSGKKRKINPGKGVLYRGRSFTSNGYCIPGGQEIELVPGQSVCLLRIEDGSPPVGNAGKLFPGS